MEALKITPQEQLKHWTDLWFVDSKKAGYVAVTDFEKQYFYGLHNVHNLVRSTAGRKKQFISINSFDVNFQQREFSREGYKLKQIRNIAIDIDQYKLGLTIDEVIDELQALRLSNQIPEPNLILTSRGVQLFYTIDRGASPKMSWLASYITEQLISKLEHIGADSNAKDTSRVMRVPNSINERNNAKVEPAIWNDVAYSLHELQSYCKPLEQFGTRKRTKNNIVQFPDKKLSFFYVTNHARLTDLHKLIELRNGDLTGMRNVFLYMYSYHQSLVLNTQKDVIASVKNTFKDVYSRMDKPMSNKDFERTVKSAYKDAETFFNHFKDNDYMVVCKTNDGIKKPYKTSNVIDKLNITEKEQFKMKSLRNAEIAKRQHAEYMESQRRAEGINSMQEYNQTRQDQQSIKVSKLADLLEQFPNAKHKELSGILNVSTKTIQRLFKVIDR